MVSAMKSARKSPRKTPGISDVNFHADSGPRGLHIFPDVKALSQAVARNMADRIKTTLTAQASFSLVLAGGSTPGVLYQLLASEYREQIPWAQLHLFWGDERYVPPSDPHSNYRMARETLLGHVPIPKENLHPMPTGFPEAEDAATAVGGSESKPILPMARLLHACDRSRSRRAAARRWDQRDEQPPKFVQVTSLDEDRTREWRMEQALGG